MGLRDRFLGKVKSAMGRGGSGAGFDASGLPNAPSGDGYKAVAKVGAVAEGEIKGCTVKCPYHDWEYDFTTGKCVTWPENKLETYFVREKDGFLWLGPVATPGTSMRGGDHNDGMKVIVK